MRTAYIYINYNNIVVLKDYLDVIKTALEKLKYNCQYIKTLEGISKDSLIIYPMSKDALKYYLHGYHNFAVWQQGATADESFMRNHSKIRRFVLNQIDIFCMKKAKFILFVSEYMRKHYERLSKRNYSNKSYVMPCFNEVLDEGLLFDKDYSKNVFTYVGSLDLWQCFRETAKLYVEIENRVENCFFKVLTFQVDEAKSILQEVGAKNYSVNCVPKEQVKNELKECTYGFIIREDSIVNRVATPTKISSYLSSGVIPIFSSCLKDFENSVKGMKCAYVVDNEDIDGMVDFICEKRDKKAICNDILTLFDGYYNKSSHTARIENLLRSVL